jgi:hypothetical protein
MTGAARPASAPARRVTPLDPDSPAGRAAGESLSQALAEILVAVQRRERAAQTNTDTRTAA